MAVITAVVAAGAAIVGTAVAIDSAQSAKRANKRAGKANLAIAKLENARSRRAQIREANITQGSVAARSAVSGGGGGFGGVASSSARGQSASVQSQLRSNLRHIDESTALSSIASSERIKANEASANAAIGGAIANAGLTALNLFAPGGQLANI